MNLTDAILWKLMVANEIFLNGASILVLCGTIDFLMLIFEMKFHLYRFPYDMIDKYCSLIIFGSGRQFSLFQVWSAQIKHL